MHLPKQEMGVPSLGQENPLEKGIATHSSSLAGEFHRKTNKQKILRTAAGIYIRILYDRKP